MIGIDLDFHDRSSVGYNRSTIDHNRLRTLSSQQHLLAISAAKEVVFRTFSGTVFGEKMQKKCVQEDVSKHILFAVYFDGNRCQILGSINRNRNPFDPMIDYN